MITQETIDQAERVIAGLQWPTPHSSAHIAQALSDAGLLADPDDAALIELAESLTHQSCPNGVHPDWFINSEHNLRCPWCVRDEARDHATNLKATMGERIAQAEKITRDVMAERDAALATIQRVRDQLALAQNVPVHVGGGNLVSRTWMVTADAIREAIDGDGQ